MVDEVAAGMVAEKADRMAAGRKNCMVVGMVDNFGLLCGSGSVFLA